MNVDDLVFTGCDKGVDITPGRLYRVKEASLKGFEICDDVGYRIYIYQSVNYNSMHLAGEGWWYKLECSILKRHNDFI